MLRLAELEYSPNYQSLSAFRILFAFYLLVQFAHGFAFYGDFYTASGIAPLSALAAGKGIAGLASLLPLVRLADESGLATLVPVLYPLSLLALAVGYRTRWANGAAFVLNCYLFWRNPYLISGAEELVRLLLLWGLFLPINRYWSIDAALDRAPRNRPYPALPFFALRLQIASLYFFSGLFKLEGLPWRQGYALDWTLRDDLYAGTPLGMFLAGHAPLLLIAVGYLLIAFQLSFPYLIYSPWRNDLTRALAIAGSVTMHVSFIVFLHIGGFPYICLIMLMLLVPDSWWDQLLRRRRNRLRGWAIYYEPGCGFCEKVVRLLREFLLAPTVRVRPASANRAALRLLTRHGSWVVVDPRGRAHLKWRAMAIVLEQSPVLAPLGRLTDRPVLRPAMARIYDSIGARRRCLGAVTRRVLPFRSDRPIGRFALALNGGLAALALASNFVSLDQRTIDQPHQEIHAASYAGFSKDIDEFFAVMQVRQAWALFAPVPIHYNWTFDFHAVDRTGSTADLAAALPFRAAREEGPMRFNRLAWVQYFRRFDLFSDADWTALGGYLCRVAGARQGPVAAIEIAFSRQPIPSPEPGGATFFLHRRFVCGASN
jgi:hypothetical protein